MGIKKMSSATAGISHVRCSFKASVPAFPVFSIYPSGSFPGAFFWSVSVSSPFTGKQPPNKPPHLSILIYSRSSPLKPDLCAHSVLRPISLKPPRNRLKTLNPERWHPAERDCHHFRLRNRGGWRVGRCSSVPPTGAPAGRGSAGSSACCGSSPPAGASVW